MEKKLNGKMKRFISLGTVVLVLLSFLTSTVMAEMNIPGIAAEVNHTGIVSGVEVENDGKTVEVGWSGETAAALVVEVYDNAGEKLLKKQQTPVAPSAANNTIKVAFSSLPSEGFLLKVTLQDASGKAISETYVQNRYTKEIQALLAETPTDYANRGDRVIELTGNDLDNGTLNAGSFVVLNDNATLLKEGTDGLVVSADTDESSKGYTIELDGVNSELQSKLSNLDLKDDTLDVAFVIDGPNYCAFKITMATVTGTTAVLSGSSDQLMPDEYCEAGSLSVNASQQQFQKNINIPIMSYGQFSSTLMGTLTMELDWNLISAYCLFKTDYRFDNSKVTLDTPDITVSIPIVSIPVAGIPILAELDVELSLDLAGKGSGSLVFHTEGALGFETGYSSGRGVFFNSCSTAPTSTYDGFEFEGEIFLGIGAGPAFKVLKVLSIEAKLSAGAVATGKIDSVEYRDQEKKWHACADFRCLQGDFRYRMSYSFSISFGIFGRGTGGDLYVSEPFSSWYHSLTFDDGEIGPSAACPHEGYRLYVKVIDSKGAEVTGAEVSYTPKETPYAVKASGKTDDKGRLTLYLPFIKSETTGKYEPGAVTITVNAKAADGHTYKMDTAFTEEGYKAGSTELVVPELTVRLSKYQVDFKDTGSGSAEKMPEAMEIYGSTGALPDNIPEKTGYTFQGWSKDQNGTTVDYFPGSMINLDKDTTLYAVWKPVSYTIAYDLGGGAVGTENPQTYTIQSDTFTLNNPAQPNHIFTGWTGTGLDSSTQEVTIAKGSTGDRQYKANWIWENYTIEFNSNKPKDASHEISGTMADQVLDYDESKTLAKNSYGLPGWKFTGWNTAADGSGTSYTDEEVVSKLSDTGSITLYAQWVPKTYQVYFIDQLHTGIMPPQTMQYDNPAMLTKNSLTFEGHRFIGWRGMALGSHYGDNQLVCNLGELDNKGNPGDVTLHAEWVAEGTTIVMITDNRQPYDPPTGVKLQQDSSSFGLTKTVSGRYEADDLPQGTYEVVIDDLDTGARSLTVDSSGSGLGRFDYCTVAIDSENPGTAWIGEVGTTSLEKVLLGSQLKIGTAMDKEGYHFESYTATGVDPTWEDNDATKAEQTVTVNGETLISAHPTANLYSVKFEANADNAQGAMADQDMVFDEPQDLFRNQFTREGYTFARWTRTAEWSGTTEAFTDGQNVQNLTTENAGIVTLYAQWDAIPSYIDYNANGGSGTMPAQKVFYGGTAPLDKNSFTRTDWHFIGWNTKADGTGTPYTDEAQYTNTSTQKDSTLHLYAQWEHDSYTVKFDANGGTGTMDSQNVWTNSGWEIPLVSFVKTGYTATQWNTEADGSGKMYAAGEAPTGSLTDAGGEITLYAQWDAIPSYIDYNANGGSGTMPQQKVFYGGTAPLDKNSFTRTDWHFTGWNTKADGTGTPYTDEAQYTNTSTQKDSTLHLYAQWEHDSYTVKFDANGGTGTMDSQNVWTNSGWEIPLVSFVKTGYTATQWNTEADGSGKMYAAGEAPTGNLTDAGGEITLYAQWDASPYTVIYDAGGGKGRMDNQVLTYDSGGALAANRYTRSGYQFTGWKAYDTDTKKFMGSFKDQEAVNNICSLSDKGVPMGWTLVAQWEKNDDPKPGSSSSDPTQKGSWPNTGIMGNSGGVFLLVTSGVALSLLALVLYRKNRQR